MIPNALVWLKDEGEDAPEDGTVCVTLECAGEFHGNPVEIGDSCINEYFDRLESLPLANLLREKGGGFRAVGCAEAPIVFQAGW